MAETELQLPDPLIEAIARALCIADGGLPDAWIGVEVPYWWVYKPAAATVLAAVEPIIRERVLREAAEVAAEIPEGFECRSCGGAAYNWLMRCHRYQTTGEGCCADFRAWIARARMKAALQTVELWANNPIQKEAPHV